MLVGPCLSAPLRSPLKIHRPILHNRGPRTLRAVQDKSDLNPSSKLRLATETRELIDQGMGYIDSAIYQCLVPHTPEMMPFTAAAWLAKFLCSRLERARDGAFMGDRKKAFTLLLKPFTFSVPFIGWMLALQNLLGGVEYMFHVCDARPDWIVSNPFMNTLHLYFSCTSPARCFISNMVAVLALGTITWVLLQLKRNLLDKTISNVGLHASADMERTLLPVDTLFTWAIIGLSVLLSLKIVGLDPSPLLTVGSVSGIIVGFASQQLLLNLMSGISIFITQPFIVGDYVDVKANNSLLVSGTVARISPLRTTFLDSNGQAVTLPNKQLSDLIITKHGDTGILDARDYEHTAPRLKQILSHDIVLGRPRGHPSAAYDELAKRLITALLVRLSVLPSIKKDSAMAFVSELTKSGDIVIKVMGTAVHSEEERPEAARQEFLLAIHNVQNTLLAEEEAKGAGKTVEEVLQ